MRVVDRESFEWAAALADRYFRQEFAGEPVTFCVDRFELSAMCGLPPEEAVDDLAAYVAAQVMPSYQFSRVLRSARRWKREPVGPPPMLPLLALNVLVASEMKRGERGGRPPFYQPLMRYLGGPIIDAASPGDYSEAVPECWEILRWWLDEHLSGQLGVSTIHKHDHFANIGYSLQQAVLRLSDRRHLYRFFRTIGIEPGEPESVGSPGDLRYALEIWSRRQGSPMARLLRLATDESLRSVCEDLLSRLATNWNGRLLPTGGSKNLAELRLLMPDAPPFRLRLVSEMAEELSEKHFALANDAGQELNLVRDGRVIRFDPDLDAGRFLESGLRLRSEDLEAFFDAAEVYCFHRGSDPPFYPAWVSTSKLRYGEIHVLLVKRNHSKAITDWLARERAEGEIAHRLTPLLPDGWLAIRGVRVHHRPLTSPPPVMADLLRSGGGLRLRLVGGLRVTGVPRTYLVGGAPLVALPAEYQGQAQLTKEDHGQEQFHVSGAEFDLGPLDLQQGRYTLVIGDRDPIDFEILEGFSSVPPTGVGSVRLRDSEGRPVTGLRGGGAQPNLPVSVPCTPGPGSIVLGPAGETDPIVLPLWMDKIAGPLSWTHADHWKPYSPVWRLDPNPTGYSATLINSIAPRVPFGSDGSRLIESAALSEESAPEVVQLWNEYHEVADG